MVKIIGILKNAEAKNDIFLNNNIYKINKILIMINLKN